MFVLFLAFGNAKAQTDTIRTGDNRLHLSALKMGQSHFVLFIENSRSAKSLTTYLIKYNIQKIKRNGSEMIAVDEQWLGNDTLSFIHYYALNKASDFAPVYQYELSENSVKAYSWDDAAVKGSDTTAGNTKKDFALKLNEPTFNGNLDFFLLQMLPLADGKSFAVNFYLAGQKPPGIDVYKVEGSELIGATGAKIACWKLVTEGTYANGKSQYKQTFFISKKDHQLIEQEDIFGGTKIVKIKIL